MSNSYQKIMTQGLKFQNKPTATQPEIIHSQFPQLTPIMAETHVPGMSVSALNGNTIIIAESGVANAVSNDLVTDQTSFAAASLSKLPMVYLVLKLIEQGKLDEDFLTQPLYTILPTHKPFFAPDLTINFAENEHGRKLTALQILSHQTQLPNWIDANNEFTLNAKGFNYSGEAYYYLQKVLEQKLQMPFEQMMEQEVFIPLKMVNSTYSSTKSNTHLAYGHNEIMQPHAPETSSANIGGSMRTTATDYGRFLHACLHYDRLHPFLQPMVDVMHDNQPLLTWGVGWGIQDSEDGRIFFLWGSGPNVKNFTALNLDKKTAIVYFTNSENGLSMLPEVVKIVNDKIGNVDKIIEFLKDDNLYQHNTPGWQERHEALALENNGEFEAAKNKFTKALELFPQDSKSQQHLVLLSHIKPFTPATKEFLQQCQGSYGNLKITHDKDQLELEVNGKKQPLIQIADDTFLDNTEKVILQFNTQNQPTTLHCTFLNGNSVAFEQAAKKANQPTRF